MTLKVGIGRGVGHGVRTLAGATTVEAPDTSTATGTTGSSGSGTITEPSDTAVSSE